MSVGLSARRVGEVVHLALDSPGSPINILGPQLAEALRIELEAAVVCGARAVVIESAKPGSFVNGVGLLLAASSRKRRRTRQRALSLRRVYDTLASLPLTTIAAINGNCYGCGVELAIACDYRVAADGSDTELYFSEIADYRFIPLFGGTQRLPPLVGLDTAVDLLVSGRRVRAEEARALGLVDAVRPHVGFARHVGEFLDALRVRGWPPPPRRPARARRSTGRIERRLEAVPPPERPLARRCLELAARPGSAGYRLDEGLAAELEAFLDSVATPASQAAMAFFFVREEARVHGVGTTERRLPEGLHVDISGAPLELQRLLEQREVPGVRLGPTRSRRAVRIGPGQLCASIGPNPQSPNPDLTAWVPRLDVPRPVVELCGPRRPKVEVFDYLEHAGLVPVHTRARGGFFAQRLLAAWLGPVATAVALGRDGTELDAEAWRLGCSVRPSELRAYWPTPAPRGPHAPRAVLHRMLHATAAVVLAGVASGELAHPSVGDVMVHELFGFPVSRGSLLRYLCRNGMPAFAARLGRLPAGKLRTAALAALARRPRIYD